MASPVTLPPPEAEAPLDVTMDALGPEYRTFSHIDYAVFAAVLCLSLAIGMFYAFKARNKTNAEFLMGSYNLSCFPVSMSLLATYISAIMVLGGPAEAFYHGIQWWVIVFGQVALPVVALTFLPIFYKLRLTSVYEYLELRYESRFVRSLGAGTFIIQMVLYQAVVIYAPALALASVTGFPVWASIVIVCVIGTIYTALGGLRAVVWTDVIQILIVVSGLMAIIIQGSVMMGGFSKVWQIAKENGRTGPELFKFYIDPFERHTVFNVILSSMLTKITLYSCHQTQVQRYSSMKNLKHAYTALLLNAPGYSLLVSLSMLAGLVIFAVYSTCDPLASGRITSKDQILPLYVMEYMSHYSGLPGLFVACIFSGALSTVSSGLNSLAAVTWSDALCTHPRFASMSETVQAQTTKMIALIFGALCMGFSFLAQRLGGVLQAAIAVSGSAGGPLLGIFTMGIFMPFANAKGACAGLLSGQIVALTITFGAMTLSLTPQLLPTSVDGCIGNITHVVQDTIRVEDLTYPKKLLAISYTMYCPLGLTVSIVVGTLVSLLTCYGEKKKIDPDLLHPCVRWAVADLHEEPNHQLTQNGRGEPHDITTYITCKENNQGCENQSFSTPL
ncbi:sodium-coupled monocarboxylate transporter 1-like [Oratosquilla oratoria]|uniref:sodium-coupled monocarboxylate transporter 1-like n=1 Tax=Oratosquilla oratoria TaxID=337810 RepID=UPI003F76AE95